MKKPLAGLLRQVSAGAAASTGGADAGGSSCDRSTCRLLPPPTPTLLVIAELSQRASDFILNETSAPGFLLALFFFFEAVV